MAMLVPNIIGVMCLVSAVSSQGSSYFSDVLGGKDVPATSGGGYSCSKGWPWTALLGTVKSDGKNPWYCNGVLISDQWVLTAAHCVMNQRLWVVRLGEQNINDNDHATDYGFSQIIVHPDYQVNNTFENYHSLALIQLNKKVVFTGNIKAIQLPRTKNPQDHLVGNNAAIAGWGATKFGGTFSSILQEFTVEVFPAARCDEAYRTLHAYAVTFPRGIDETTFLCAGKRGGGANICAGGSGSPLMSCNGQNWVLEGLMAYGYGCGLKDYPTLYIPIGSPRYLRWIKDLAF